MSNWTRRSDSTNDFPFYKIIPTDVRISVFGDRISPPSWTGVNPCKSPVLEWPSYISDNGIESTISWRYLNIFTTSSITSAYWCFRSGMDGNDPIIQSITIHPYSSIIPATPSKPSIPCVKRTSKSDTSSASSLQFHIDARYERTTRHIPGPRQHLAQSAVQP